MSSRGHAERRLRAGCFNLARHMTFTAEPSTDPLDIAPQSLDRALNAQLARFTPGISPAALIGAYMDWAVHLAMAPGKRLRPHRLPRLPSPGG